MSKLDDAVSKGDGDRWDFRCPGIRDSVCGDKGVPFTSTGWPTKKTATERGREHFAEHVMGAPMSSLEAFRAKHGLGVDDDGNAVTLADLEAVVSS